MLNLVQSKKIIVKRELEIGKKEPAISLLKVLFIIAVLSAAVQTADAVQVTLVPNSTGSYGFNGTLESDGTSTWGGSRTDFKTSTVLPANALTALSSLDASASTNSKTGTAGDDEYINVTFVIDSVQSCNWIVGNFQGLGTTDVPHLGIVNTTGGFENKSTATAGTPYRNLTFNQSTNLASYCIMSGNTASITLVGWGRGTSTGTITGSYFNVTVDYVPYIPPPTYTPPAPANLVYTTGNFWVNNTWEAGAGVTTDSYNVSVNGPWTNGTTTTYYNSSVGAHGWSNISVYAFNNSGGGSLNSTPAALNTQVANNVPVQTLADTWAITAGNLLTFTVSATDADSDPLSHSTNATKGSFNPAGKYSWMPASADVGTYLWSFSSSDGFGGTASNTTTITVTDIPPSMTFINGTVLDNATKAGIGGVTVSTNTSISTTTDASGFYSLPVTAGTYQLTAALEPVYYTNSSMVVTVGSGAVVVQDIELVMKPTGTITGSVTNA